jgi:hypothetical protein
VAKRGFRFLSLPHQESSVLLPTSPPARTHIANLRATATVENEKSFSAAEGHLAAEKLLFVA